MRRQKNVGQKIGDKSDSQLYCPHIFLSDIFLSLFFVS